MLHRRLNLSMEFDEFLPTVSDIISHINSMASEGLFLISGYSEPPQISVVGSLVVPKIGDEDFRELHDKIWDACMENIFEGFSFAGVSANETLMPVPGHDPELYLREFTLSFRGKNILIHFTIISKELYINM